MIATINSKIQNGAIIIICPWESAHSNQCLVRVKSVAGNRTVTYTWQGLDDLTIIKTSQVSHSVWYSIIDQATNA